MILQLQMPLPLSNVHRGPEAAGLGSELEPAAESYDATWYRYPFQEVGCGLGTIPDSKAPPDLGKECRPPLNSPAEKLWDQAMRKQKWLVDCHRAQPQRQSCSWALTSPFLPCFPLILLVCWTGYFLDTCLKVYDSESRFLLAHVPTGASL